jgi:hypothetical protein
MNASHGLKSKRSIPDKPSTSSKEILHVLHHSLLFDWNLSLGVGKLLQANRRDSETIGGDGPRFVATSRTGSQLPENHVKTGLSICLAYAYLSVFILLVIATRVIDIQYNRAL